MCREGELGEVVISSGSALAVSYLGMAGLARHHYSFSLKDGQAEVQSRRQESYTRTQLIGAMLKSKDFGNQLFIVGNRDTLVNVNHIWASTRHLRVTVEEVAKVSYRFAIFVDSISAMKSGSSASLSF